MRRLFAIFLFLLVQLPVVAQVSDSVSVGPVEEQAAAETTTFYFHPLTSDTEVRARMIPQEAVARLKRDGDYWYADSSFRKPRQDARVPVSQQSGSNSLFWVIIALLFLGILTWFLAASDIRLFRPAAPLLQADGETAGEEDIFGRKFEKEIRQAEAEGNYRAAVRLRYLSVLKALADGEHIRYQQGSTNTAYVRQLYGTAFYQGFFRLTRSFDYVWYGQFPLNESQYDEIAGDFRDFQKEVEA